MYAQANVRLCTAIPYRASTGPEQGFPCEVFHTGKNLFSLQGTPVLIAGTPVFITGISLWENFTGKTLFSLQGLQCSRAGFFWKRWISIFLRFQNLVVFSCTFSQIPDDRFLESWGDQLLEEVGVGIAVLM